MFTRFCLASTLFFAVVPLLPGQTPAPAKKPNVIVIITDDQGFGDLGFHGNPKIRTPNLDKFAGESVRMKNFHVCPVCSPTRSSLMTGRYNYRTGIVDTFNGRSMMHPDEVTIAKLLKGIGYRTGIFGKWHLGDNYPLRAMDQGFEEALVLKGGGIGQASDPPGGESYFNPILQHNGKAERKEGYCSDIYTDAVLDFISKKGKQPFFCYLAFNCPHTPLEVPEKYYKMYAGQLKADQFPKAGYPIEGKVDFDATAKIYGMITNIDDNVGRIFARLKELGIADDTIVIFLTDNGPQQPRYNRGMRGRKGTTFEGGTHVPFFVRWPAQLPGNRDIDRIAAHIDILPTLAAACGAQVPQDRQIDGRNLLPLWKNEKVDWPDRSLFFQWHRGDVPEMYRACAVRNQRYRLVQPDGVAENFKLGKVRFMLFDIEKDPYEMKDIAAEQPEIVAQLKKQYEDWFKDVAGTRQFAPPRIRVGSAKENPVVLTRQDWRSAPAGTTPKGIGRWGLEAEKDGKYEIEGTLTMPARKGATFHLLVGTHSYEMTLEQDAEKTVQMRGIALPAGPLQLGAWISEGGSVRPMRLVSVAGPAK
jgi:arylsulfatase A-like enzyme